MLVLAIRRFTMLYPKTYFVTGKGDKRRTIKFRSNLALGPAKMAALPGNHAFTGADVTGSKSKADLLESV